MKNTLDKVCFEAEKVNAMIYAYERVFVSATADDNDPDFRESAAYAFYAIADAVSVLLDELYVLEGDRRVNEAIRESKCAIEVTERK